MSARVFIHTGTESADIMKLDRTCPPKGALTVLAALLLAGCAITPTPVSEQDVRARIDRDREAMYRNQEAIAAPIGLDEAVARALKYNLDYRLKAMESALSAGLADVSKYDMLPNLLLSAGYSSRSNASGGNSVNIETGAVSLASSTSQERSRALAAAEFSWNVLDFGVSYYRARQQADQVMIADERRRRVIQNILQDVRSAYWRAVGAQRLAREAEGLGERVSVALERSREAERQGLVPPREALNYQRLLLDAHALLNARRQELAFARHELAALMNVPPGTAFTVAEVDEPELRGLPADVAPLEDMALQNRPELREEDYRARITADEARRQILSLMPGLSLTSGLQYDSNKYLYNSNWLDVGARVSFNLFRVLSYPAMKNAQQAQQNADEARRLGLSMAVLTQVRVAIERYRLALVDLDAARESSLVDQRLASYARAGLSARADAELELIRAETRALNSEYQRYAAYASAQAAFGRIYNALGLEVIPDGLGEIDLQALSGQVAARVQSLESDTFPVVAKTAQVLPALHVRVDLAGSDAGADLSRVVDAVRSSLRRNHVPEAAADAAAPVLTLQLRMQPVREGVRRAEWLIDLRAADGRPLGESRYLSTLPASANARTIAAFGEAAAVANLAMIERSLKGAVQP